MADTPSTTEVIQVKTDTTQASAGDPIGTGWKIFSGTLLIGLTLFSALYIIGHWPDKFVKAGDGTEPLYCYEWFHVRLAGVKTPAADDKTTTVVVLPATGAAGANPAAAPPVDTVQTAAHETVTQEDIAAYIKNKQKEAVAAANKKAADCQICNNPEKDESHLWHINTILLIMVAFGGFLGNMIYIATSFTTFIGEDSFKKSWVLWYCVKPFTASALAVTFYFVFRGGFLNMSDDGSSINLYGLMTLSILTGLFTDRATLKLKEVFEVLMKPKEERSDPLDGNAPVIKSVTATVDEAGKEATVTITGTKLNNGLITITVNGNAITGTDIQAGQITFKYPVPEDGAENITVTIKPDAKSIALEYKVKIKKQEAQEPEQGEPEQKEPGKAEEASGE